MRAIRAVGCTVRHRTARSRFSPQKIAAPWRVDSSKLPFELILDPPAALGGAIPPSGAEHAPIKRNRVMEVRLVQHAEPPGTPQRSGGFQVHQGSPAIKSLQGPEFLVGNQTSSRWVASKLREQRIQGFRAGIEAPPIGQQGRRFGEESELVHLAHRDF